MRKQFAVRWCVGLLAGWALSAYAQLPEVVQRSSNPSGIRIQGETAVRAQAESSHAVAVGADNAAKTATGAVRGNVNIRGNTRIDAQSRETNAVAVGQANKADNAVGAIGDK